MPYLIHIYKKPKKGSAWADVKTNHDLKEDMNFFFLIRFSFAPHVIRIALVVETVKINMSKNIKN